ncbi:MAG TPA: PAS domain S-box protein [Ramlibacter sp.]|nr:PAS domain S-box protein [Ramlibacter sp.]
MSDTGFACGAGEKAFGATGAEFQRQEALLKTGALQDAIFNSANFSSIATDEKGVIQIFNVGAERMLGYSAADVLNKITPADISDPQEIIVRAKALSAELGTPIMPGFEALVFKASRGIEDIYELTYIRKDGSRFPAIVSVTALRDARESIIGYLLIGTDNTARKQAEQALGENYALLRAIHLHSLVSVTDREGRIVDANDGFCKISGYSRDEMLGQTHRIVNSGVQSRAFWTDMWQTIAAGQPWRGEICNRAKDGALYWVDSIIAPFMGEDGQTRRYISVRTDITARKQAEEALLKAGALQSAIFNSANFSSIATDAKGVIQIFNVGAERMLGYTAAEVMNTITPADISDPQEVIARAEALSVELGTSITPGFEALVFKASRGIEDIYELTYIRKDGSRFGAIVSVTALRDAQEGIIGYLLIGTDNTARQQVEAARALLDQRLRDQQFYTRSLIESNIDALMMTDPQGIISDVNHQMIALTGRTRDELIGAPCKNFFTDPGRAEAAIKRVLTENKVNNYELTVRALNGDETVVSYNAATFYDRDRKLQGVFAAARDITERKRFDRTLQEKNLELEHATRMKSEFLATMSHELRTPLNAIIGFSEALKDGLIGKLGDDQQECILDIFSSGQHLLALINDILDLSKVEAGMMALELEPVDLASLLASSLTIVREKAAAQQISLELETDADLGVPQLDMRKTKQIVYNLLSNAVKFSASGGRVLVRAQRVPRSAVGTMAGSWPIHSFPLAPSSYQEFLQLSVTDSGIGITRANMGKLFQAFSQIDSSLARKFEGTGLGLAMVRQLSELHGGGVAVASAEGEGASFAVWLPLRKPDDEAPAPRLAWPQAAAIPVDNEEERVALVVEDDERSAELMRLLLEAEGFSVVCAPTAETAILTASQHKLSLITLDIRLPGTSGWGLLQRLRESAGLAHVPVVIVAGEADRGFALDRGAAAILQKPISRAQLKSTLSSIGLQAATRSAQTILVIDDDPKAVQVIAALLPEPAYSVIRAFGGAEAIQLAQKIKPDLIVLDLMMPTVTGFDVVQALRVDAGTADIPVLVVTAMNLTAQQRTLLSDKSGNPIAVVEKAQFNSAGMLAEIRRALRAKEESSGTHPDH